MVQVKIRKVVQVKMRKVVQVKIRKVVQVKIRKVVAFTTTGAKTGAKAAAFTMTGVIRVMGVIVTR